MKDIVWYGKKHLLTELKYAIVKLWIKGRITDMNCEEAKNQENTVKFTMREKKTTGRRTIAVFFGGNVV